MKMVLNFMRNPKLAHILVKLNNLNNFSKEHEVWFTNTTNLQCLFLAKVSVLLAGGGGCVGGLRDHAS